MLFHRLLDKLNVASKSWSHVYFVKIQTVWLVHGHLIERGDFTLVTEARCLGLAFDLFQQTYQRVLLLPITTSLSLHSVLITNLDFILSHAAETFGVAEFDPALSLSTMCSLLSISACHLFLLILRLLLGAALLSL